MFHSVMVSIVLEQNSQQQGAVQSNAFGHLSVEQWQLAICDGECFADRGSGADCKVCADLLDDTVSCGFERPLGRAQVAEDLKQWTAPYSLMMRRWYVQELNITQPNGCGNRRIAHWVPRFNAGAVAWEAGQRKDVREREYDEEYHYINVKPVPFRGFVNRSGAATPAPENEDSDSDAQGSDIDQTGPHFPVQSNLPQGRTRAKALVVKAMAK